MNADSTPPAGSATERSIEAVARGLVRKWISESKVTRYITSTDEDQLVDLCLHAYDLGKQSDAATG